ncbi:helix-turn-helix domain-containing protein [Acinetobacter sp. TR11]|uniref:helix-turn-helix domain-containing protein n=1 Tax=Acinetobacter sp. TR11 TaxID=3003393 RepID=UPI0022ABE6A1|nr:helix-turn-helix transcriptional regulator [Acinetobacter sp. TR11]WAU72394.1 helix-turn-helix transcriptional regulator [Acinetobacter sp. TR11]
MRVRPRKENPKSRQSSLNYERKRVLQSALLFEKYRDIDGFLASLKERLKDRGLSVKQIQINLGFNKKVIYSWLRGEKIPSQKYQVAVCEYLDIPYHKLALTPNEQGDYPCGMRVCNVCGCEFAVFKKINYGQMKCCSCIQLNSPSK